MTPLTIVKTCNAAFSSKYTQPTLSASTPTRPCFLHRVGPLTRRRAGGPLSSPSRRRGLIVRLFSGATGHLLVGPRRLRGRFAFRDTLTVASEAIKRHLQEGNEQHICCSLAILKNWTYLK